MALSLVWVVVQVGLYTSRVPAMVLDPSLSFFYVYEYFHFEMYD
jgi:hypothetical protein